MIGPFPNDVSGLTRLTTLLLSSNEFSGPFPSTLAPPSLKMCSILPNNVQVVPPGSVLANSNSLANRCGVKAPNVLTTKSEADTKQDVGFRGEQDEQNRNRGWEGQQMLNEMNDDERTGILPRKEEEPLIGWIEKARKKEVEANRAVSRVELRVENVVVGVGVAVCSSVSPRIFTVLN